jgi:hypothetical protein
VWTQWRFLEWETRTLKTRVVENSVAPLWRESFCLPFTSNAHTYETILEDEAFPNIGSITVEVADWNRYKSTHADAAAGTKVQIPTQPAQRKY